MKTKLTFTFTITLAAVFLAAKLCADIAQIETVTVFKNGACIERIAELILGEGEKKITIEKLPPDLEEDSVIVEANNADVLDVKITKKQMSEFYGKKISDLDKKIKELEGKFKAVEKELQITNSKKDFYMNLSKSISSLPSDFFKRKFEANEFDGAVKFIYNGLKITLDEKSKLEKIIEGINSEIEKTKREINDMNASGWKYEKSLEILLSSPKNLTTKLKIAYFRKGATWQPVYKIDTDVESSGLFITMQAEVNQSGGEDWNNVNIIFSTAEPMIEAGLPKPLPWVIEFMPEYTTRKKTRYTGAPAEALAPPSTAMGKSEAEVFYEEKPPAVEFKDTAYVFRGSSSVNIPSDNMPHICPIMTKKLSAQFSYKVLSDYTQFAYLIGEGTLPEDFPVMRGATNIFHKGAYIGKGETDFTSGGSKLELFVGVDKNIFIEKKLLRKKEYAEGVFSKETKKNHAYKIILKNPYNKEISLELLARMPLSRHENIKVKTIKITPEAKIDKDSGFIIWKLLIPPKKDIELYYEFDVFYPKDKKILGL